MKKLLLVSVAAFILCGATASMGDFLVKDQLLLRGDIVLIGDQSEFDYYNLLVNDLGKDDGLQPEQIGSATNGMARRF